MSLSVSSWFIEQTRAHRAAPLRRFTLGGSDYSDAVLRWPTLRFRAETIDLGTTAVQLSNIDGAFQTLVNCPYQLTAACELALGYLHPDSGAEYLSLFQGAPTAAAFTRGGTELRLQMQGKTRRLGEVSLGSAVESAGLDFTGSAHHPSDLAWVLVTCHGELSAIASESNPDIDYAEWQSWRDADAVRDVRVQAYLTGERVFQALDTLALMASRVISVRNGRLRFRDAVEPYSTAPPVFPADTVVDAALTLDPARLTNHFFVEAAFDPAKGAFTTQFTKVHSQSEVDFGRRSGRFSSRGLWFASDEDARYLAEDRVRFGHSLLPSVRLRTPLAGGLEVGVGDVVTWTDSAFAIAAQPFRVLEQAVDLDRGQVELTLASAQRRPWERQSTVSSENLVVRTLAVVGSATLLAFADTLGVDRLVRSESAGPFVPLGTHGSAVLGLGNDEVLVGGIPNSGGVQAVLQRSSDAGSSTTVVSSLAPNVPLVYHLFQVVSGTLLAGVWSGGIYRSTDAGSSWSLTQTISGAYHIRRFVQPYSGAIWGATGYSNPLQGVGFHIWESLDDGVSWAPRDTIHADSNFRASGWHVLSGSEWLLGHFGIANTDRGTLRGTFTAPGSVAWTTVFTQVSFANVIETDSGHLLMGFDEETTLTGGAVYRSLDQGSSWSEDARLAKRGNLVLLRNADGTLDAIVSRMSVGPRTDRFRNFAPDEIT